MRHTCALCACTGSPLASWCLLVRAYMHMWVCVETHTRRRVCERARHATITAHQSRNAQVEVAQAALLPTSTTVCSALL